ncbi:MAG: hypothetical protein EBR02_04880 [Alphaproteobacteria bacterium]|nr:hypothetical protein [Alphaproteobacteria bacterium]
MALIKAKTHKGQTYEYWGWVRHVQDKVENTTIFVVGAFKDQATRNESVTNELAELRVFRTYEGILTLEECYALFKASNATDTTPNTNWFSDAEGM